jgi:hypothetical protein
VTATKTADKIVTDWLEELGKHGADWDDLADLKDRIAKALNTSTVIRHAFNAGVAWAIGNGMNIEEYLEARKEGK